MEGRLGITPSRSRGRRGTFAAVLMAAALMCLGLTACESTRADIDGVRRHINQSRAAVGLPPLRENPVLVAKADRWAQTLRNSCRIWHSDPIEAGAPRFDKLGENVGMGGSIAQIHVAYMNSPGHRANILDPAFSEVGTAAVWGNCNGYRTVFTVQVFMDPR